MKGGCYMLMMCDRIMDLKLPWHFDGCSRFFFF